MKILVTGGAGFIGSNFVLGALADTQHSFIVLDAMTYAANPASLQGALEAYDATRLRFVRGSITHEDLVDSLVSQVDLVVHFAAESHNDRSLHSPLDFVRTNVEGTAVLLAASARYKVRFHHVSTDEVFGDLAFDDPARFRPDTPYRPSSPYSASKAASDHLVRAWVRSFGLEATISNCSNNYGPRQHPEKFIPRQILNLLADEPPRVYGTGRNVRDWIHVEDHNSAVWTIIERGTPGNTYLIGADGEHSNMEVVRELNEIFGRDPDDFLHVSDRPGHDRRYAIDPASTRELGWEPRHGDFREGLCATVEWYRENPQWWEAAFAASESAYRKGERQFPH
ncbi:dTDP-glucose 4,6-dehydratase [Corynebacterium lowii]|uniref:dTDP-glucose 4,6-dehydratase n=1 Tax=Corynebacterium lowii TaxID=1544413 RepID=A0A0Q0YKC0_9CORY|nr:dTDP-glucose 4,6-dehydratase [Corynebacterium lowii]KQB87331.1 dTDP-glucose 4,6-dehydratase [Corynebacterium lowii]MDP9852080.1 dTDP-glucose 4,6-dehydratase [Corynebacterium lowii]